jgi:hypothetical protein
MAAPARDLTGDTGRFAGLRRMARTTAFKLSAVYLLIFAIFSGIILGYLAGIRVVCSTPRSPRRSRQRSTRWPSSTGKADCAASSA